ncbi:ribulose-bisphosphate carboxylase large subunit family protein [Haloplanus halophilus]|uniref:ribulose-bisphosphate carboxylase large subunit family protein n=1 Tax=Haloplanus halophilus TaxID=2949993 RepID=UPI00203EED34|nr:ribulose-bisphosphate carboxylase large subunit family protein [Haloplanus sp. GDY1]
MTDRFTATYRIETPASVREAADAMAGEQSASTFVDVPGESEELQRRHGADVVDVTELGTTAEPTLPGVDPGSEEASEYTRAEVRIAYPIENVGVSVPQLRTTVAGNVFEMQPLSGIRLLDVDVPDVYGAECPTPQFGVEGTRELIGVHDRPIVGTIIKPSVGLSPDETASLVETLVEAGVDFIKDDELIADPPYSRFEDRVEAVMSVIDDHAEETGKRVMYAFNVTGSVEEMRRRHDVVAEAGGTCVMVSLNSVGLAGVLALRRHSDLAIHGHRNGWGALSRCPQLGFEYTAYQKLWRLAGVDHLHVNGIRNKFTESDESVVASARAVQRPIPGDDGILPVFSSGQWADQAHDTYAALGNVDLMYLAGGGIMGHPDGPAGGVDALKQGWEAAMAGVPLAEYAEDHEALRRSMEAFGTDE